MNTPLQKTRLALFSRGAPETPTGLGLLVVVGGAWGFVKFASEVLQGETQAFDVWAVRLLR